MALGIVYGGGGNITPFCKFDGRTGRIRRVDRVLNNGKYENVEIDITDTFKAVMDLAAIERGYINFTGKAPQYALVSLDAPMPPKPQGEGWRQGVRVPLRLGKDCGDDVREITSNAEVFMKGLDALHDAYEAEKHKHSVGKLPIVALLGTEKVTGNKSTNFMPRFGIVGWTTRPDDLVLTPKVPANPNGNGGAGDVAVDDGFDPPDEYYREQGLEPPTR